MRISSNNNDVGAAEYAAQPVPQAETGGWVRVALVSAAVALSLPTFVAGLEIANGMQWVEALVAFGGGAALLAAIAALAGAIGARTRLSSYALVRIAFGRRGAELVNFAFALSLLGWFGVNIELVSTAMLRLARDLADYRGGDWPFEALAGVLMTVTAILGFRSLARLSVLLVPVMGAVTLVMLSAPLEPRVESAMLPAESALGMGGAMSAVVGAFIVGAVIMPDITRFIRHWPGAVWTAMLSYLAVVLVMTAAAIAGAATGTTDLLAVLLALGFGAGAFIIVAAGSWTLNALNLYSCALSIQATRTGMRRVPLLAALGAIGVLAAFVDILSHLLTFLSYLAIVFVPVAGVIIVDYFVVSSGAYPQLEAHGDACPPRSAKSVPGVSELGGWALGAWALGAAIAVLASEGVISLSGIAAVDALLAAAGAYSLFGLCARRILQPAAQ